MRTIEKSGKTVDEAISAALEELKLTLSNVKVEIVKEGSRGLMGVGAEEAIVRVTEKVKSGMGPKAAGVLKELLAQMGIRADVHIKEDGNTIQLEIINTPHGAILIGYRGKTLNSLQYLVNQMINKDSMPDEQRFDIEIDYQDYRNRRRRMLSKMAKEAISKVQSTGNPEELEPMSAYDRKYIHMLLKDEPDVSSSSSGEGQDRHVVISKRTADSLSPDTTE